jgi:two-component system sensor histidine kinase KdpD
MKKCKTRMDESILVCVVYGPNGERLIRRGAKIANMMDCPLYILTIDPLPYEELDGERTAYIEFWRKLAEENNADEFIVMDNEKRPVAKVIAQVAREKRITQIIIGQTAQSRWREITKGSIVNVLLREIPFIDLHIVSVARALIDREDHYEKGVRAYLIPEDDGYRVSFHHTADAAYEGIFFKEIGTDFDNGIFKFLGEKGTMHVHVTDNFVKELKNVSMTD